jgi:hypothetical protein
MISITLMIAAAIAGALAMRVAYPLYLTVRRPTHLRGIAMPDPSSPGWTLHEGSGCPGVCCNSYSRFEYGKLTVCVGCSLILMGSKGIVGRSRRYRDHLLGAMVNAEELKKLGVS